MMMDKFRKTGRSCVRFLRQIYIGYGLVHIGKPIILLCYSFAGAAVFLFFEKQAEIDRGVDRTENLREMRRRIIAEMLKNVFNESEKFLLFVDGSQTSAISIMYDNAFVQYENVVLNSSSKFDVNRKMYWDFWNALVYTWTVITTIGYGHLCPATMGGRIATMIYAIFGIPLMLSILTDVGKLLTKFMKYPFLMVKMFARRVFQYCTQMTREQIKEADERDKSTLEVFDLPIPIAIATVIIWIFICSAITLVWEKEWDYLVAFYFFFISLSTIGFGDVVPSDSRYLFLLFGNIMIGLALVSMCINLMQAKLEKMNAQAAAAAAAAAAALARSASIDSSRRNSKFDTDLDGRKRWLGIGPKEIIVDIEEHGKPDEQLSYRIHTRGGRKSCIDFRRIQQKADIEKSDTFETKVASPLVRQDENKALDENENAKIEPTLQTRPIFITEHSYAANEGENDRDEIIELHPIRRRSSKFRHRSQKVTGKNSSKIRPASAPVQCVLPPNGTQLLNFDQYTQVLSSRELLDQILHETQLPKLDMRT